MVVSALSACGGEQIPQEPNAALAAVSWYAERTDTTRWKLVGVQGDSAVVTYDRQSLTVLRDGTLRLWVRADYREPRWIPTGTTRADRAQYLIEIGCDVRMMREERVTHYLGGHTVDDRRLARGWQEVIPETPEEVLVQGICA